MSDFDNLAFHLEGGERINYEFDALIDYCENYIPEARPHFELMKQSLDKFYSEGRRLIPLIWAIRKEATNDGYHGQVQDQLDKLNPPTEPLQAYLLSVCDE